MLPTIYYKNDIVIGVTLAGVLNLTGGLSKNIG